VKSTKKIADFDRQLLALMAQYGRMAPSLGSIASNTAFRTSFATLSAVLHSKEQFLRFELKHYLDSESAEIDIRIFFPEKENQR